MKIQIKEIRTGKNWRSIQDSVVQSLAASIGEVGLAYPLIVDEENRLLDGWHRLNAIKLLGWDSVDVSVKKYSSDIDRQIARIDSNLARANLTALEECEALAERKRLYLKKYPETGHGATGRKGKKEKISSFSDDAAKMTGKTGRLIRMKTQIAEQLPKEIRDAVRDTRTAERQTELQKLVLIGKNRGNQYLKKVARALEGGQASSVAEARSQIKKDVAKARPKSGSAQYKLQAVDIRDLAENAKPESVDAVVTDPPYPKDYLPLHEDLARYAARVLKPGGSLIAMVGHAYLGEILAMMSKHLEYRWILSWTWEGQNAVHHPRNVYVNWKPLLWFSKGKPDFYVSDVVRSHKQPKDGQDYHHWGQPEEGFAEIIERFTSPGDIVSDPFLGGGTTGLAAVAKGRRFLGYDIVQENIDVAAGRLSGL